jgi:hypothetical protein
VHQHFVEHVVFIQLAFRQARCKVREIDWDVEFLQQIGQGPDVVFMAVRQDERSKIVAVWLEEFKIGNGNVHPIYSFFGKTHAGIYDNHFVAVAYRHAVHPELADSAEWDYL